MALGGVSQRGPTAIGFAINAALAVLRRRDIDARSLLIRADLSEEHIGDPLRRVSAAAHASFLEYAAEALGDGTLGLHLAAGGDPRTIGLAFYLGSAAKNLGEAMALMTRFVGIADESACLKLARQPGGAVLKFNFVGLLRHLLRQQSEFALAMTLKAMRFASGREVRPTEVRIAHVRTSGLQDFARFFGCPVEFNAPCDQLAFSNETVALPLITADPQLLLTLRPICEAAAGAPDAAAGSLRASVESEIQRRLPQGQANIETVARALALSARTLSRNLAAEGSAFTEILDQLRHTLALQYLKEPNLPLAQIAWLLGYGNATSFTHAFRRWAGRPPSAVRNEGRSPQNGFRSRPEARGGSGCRPGRPILHAAILEPSPDDPRVLLEAVGRLDLEPDAVAQACRPEQQMRPCGLRSRTRQSSVVRRLTTSRPDNSAPAASFGPLFAHRGSVRLTTVQAHLDRNIERARDDYASIARHSVSARWLWRELGVVDQRR